MFQIDQKERCGFFAITLNCCLQIRNWVNKFTNRSKQVLKPSGLSFPNAIEFIWKFQTATEKINYCQIEMFIQLRILQVIVPKYKKQEKR